MVNPKKLEEALEFESPNKQSERNRSMLIKTLAHPAEVVQQISLISKDDALKNTNE